MFQSFLRLVLQVTTLGKAIERAGALGSSGLPKDALAKNVDVQGGAKFTLIENRGATNLGSASL